ncbi:hypothetical protein HN587_06935, partial [Candidatus Woesearchaeota archaeon]|nr:hypothetical protein [Candidatus Woesearchaeota archaeon]
MKAKKSTKQILNKRLLTLLIASIFFILSLTLVSAATCTVASAATAILGVSEDITVSCSGVTDAITVNPSVGTEFGGLSCLDISPSSSSVSSGSPTTTFSVEGTNFGMCMGEGKKITWSFTGTGAPGVKYTNYNIVSKPQITPTFMNSSYSVSNVSTNLSITLGLSTSNPEIDVRGIDLLVSTSLNGSEVGGIVNFSDLTIDVSESTSKFVTWTVELPPLPPGEVYDFNVSISSENADSTGTSTEINVTEASGITMVEYDLPSVGSWYLISVPVEVDSLAVTDLFGDLSGSYQVWGWNDGWVL